MLRKPRRYNLLLALAAFVPLALAADDATPQVNSPLGAVAPFIGGEWHIDGKWVNGESLKARETFEWGLAKKFIEVRTYVSKSDGSGEYERYRRAVRWRMLPYIY